MIIDNIYWSSFVLVDLYHGVDPVTLSGGFEAGQLAVSGADPACTCTQIKKEKTMSYLNLRFQTVYNCLSA